MKNTYKGAYLKQSILIREYTYNEACLEKNDWNEGLGLGIAF